MFRHFLISATQFLRAFIDANFLVSYGLKILLFWKNTNKSIKEDNPNWDWKATKGDGKSIFDCENEKWCQPKEDEKLVRTYKKIHSDEHKAPEWIEINIGPEWVEPNLRED